MAQPTTPSHHECTLLRPESTMETVMTALAAISSGEVNSSPCPY